MGKLELNKKKKKDALFNTAFELFTTKGLTKTTISDIVEQAGVAKGTFYLYFKDKYDIRNKLVSHKTGELFFHAHEALEQAGITDFEQQVHFIVDFVITELDQNRTLLLFISKNLAWGVFKGAFEEKMPDDEYNFYRSYLDMLAQNGLHYRNPELLLFTIIELVQLYSVPAAGSDDRIPALSSPDDFCNHEFLYTGPECLSRTDRKIFPTTCSGSIACPSGIKKETTRHQPLRLFSQSRAVSFLYFCLFIAQKFPDHPGSEDFLYNTVSLPLCRVSFFQRYFYLPYDKEADFLPVTLLQADRHPSLWNDVFHKV